MNIPTDFGERVRTQRQLRDLNQRDLAAMTDGIPVSYTHLTLPTNREV